MLSLARASALAGRRAVSSVRGPIAARALSSAVVNAQRPENVGIIAADMYIPKRFVSQKELESYDGVSEGRYTIGLDQQRMGFVGDREDMVSIAMSAVTNLVEKTGISWNDIGRLEVGTETLVDKSKSVKSSLMQIIGEEHGNYNVEGIDTINACYGGTQALFNSMAWVDSQQWDGRYAVCVAGDIAVYEKGNARPTGGCGAVAMLVGPNAAIAQEPRLRYTHMEDAYDFYKPNLSSEYPYVDGKLSIVCYLRALDRCYQGYLDRLREHYGEDMEARNIDYMAFHSPFGKLVQKSYARLMYTDARNHKDDPFYQSITEFLSLTPEESYMSRDLEKALMKLARPMYEEKVLPTTHVARDIGNMYCGSLYGGLCSLLDQRAQDLPGKRLMLFSYGSGLAATLFSMRVKKDVSDIASLADISRRLAEREEATPEEFSASLELREAGYQSAPYSPVESVDTVPEGAYYLKGIDDLYRRSYARKA